jgi:Uma2 family endonuclease
VAETLAYTPFEQYLEGERASQRRHELVGGRVYALAGGSERHDLVAGLLYEMLAPGARARGCRPFTSNRLVRTECGNGYYPDVMVVCSPAPHRQYETAPALIVEVLSPSTQDHDRREKAVACAGSSSLGLLLLVDPDGRRVEVARPAGGRIRDWQVYGTGDVIATPYGDIDVDACYDAVDRSPTTT